MEPGRPLGYWLKHLDRLIESALERALADQGVSRRHWQVLNVLAAGPHDRAALTDALRPFWGGGAVAPGEVVAELERRAWVERRVDGRHALTPGGAAALARLGERVEATRRRVADGVSREEYLATVAVLRRMADNLEGAASR